MKNKLTKFLTVSIILVSLNAFSIAITPFITISTNHVSATVGTAITPVTIVNTNVAATYYSPYGENVSKRFFSETTWTIETKLPRNDHWKVLYKFVFLMPIENSRWPPPQYID